MTAPLKSMGYWPASVPLLDGSKSEVEEDMDVCIDGRLETGVYTAKTSYTIIMGGGMGVGITQTSSIGPFTAERVLKSDKGQLTIAIVTDSSKSVRELPKK